MNLIWNVKLYYVSEKTGYKVRIEGNPQFERITVPWTFAEGKGKTPEAAMQAAMEEMSQTDQDSLRLLGFRST